jgi:hypothetical protein
VKPGFASPLKVALVSSLLLGACATLQQLIRPPIVAVAQERESQLVLLGPGPQRPLGGLALRLWARVENPNTVGLTLTGLEGNLFLEGARAAAVNLPLGLPLPAQRDTVIPVELALSFADLPGLADVATRMVLGQAVRYRVDGTLAVDAGPLGQPRFGPTTWLSGSATVRR